MKSYCAHALRVSGLKLRPAFSVALILLIAGSTARAADDSAVTKVEEDWELVVNAPDATIEAPQIACLMSPLGDLSSLYVILTLNHHTQPAYTPGGLQLQLWNGSWPQSTANLSSNALLQQSNETIRWTQRMSLHDGFIVFKVASASSTTWGDFSSSRELRIVANVALNNLNDYSPTVSTQSSGIGYASNLVDSLVLKRVRYYSASGLLREDTAPKVVFQQ